MINRTDYRFIKREMPYQGLFSSLFQSVLIERLKIQTLAILRLKHKNVQNTNKISNPPGVKHFRLDLINSITVKHPF